MKYAVVLIFIVLATSASAITYDTVLIGPGETYTALSAALTGEAQDLVAADVRKFFKILGGTAWQDGDVIVSSSDYTADPTRFITIFTSGTALHGGYVTGLSAPYRIINTTNESVSPNYLFYCDVPYTEVYGITFMQGKQATDDNDTLIYFDGAAPFVFQNNLVIDSATTMKHGVGMFVKGSAAGSGIVGNLFHGLQLDDGNPDNGCAVFLRSGQSTAGLDILANTFNNNDAAVFWDSALDNPWAQDQTVSVVDNIFKSTDNIALEMFRGSIADDYVIYNTTSADSIASDSTTLDGTNQTGVSYKMIDAKGRNFLLINESLSGSAVDQGVSLAELGTPTARTHTRSFDCNGDVAINDVGFDEVRPLLKVRIRK